MRNKKNVVVGLGEVLWDKFGEDIKLGGAPANFAYHSLQLGCESYVVSAVGCDSLGEALTRQLADKNLNTHICCVDFPTGVVDITLVNGQPSYHIKEQVAWDNIPFTTELKSLAERTDVACFGTLAQRNGVSRHTIMSFLENMPSSDDTIKVFDINMRQHYYSREIIEESLARCNVLKINNDELTVFNSMFGLEKLELGENMNRILSDFGIKILILTCGESGSYVATADGINFESTPKIQLVDAVGAGDSFTAAFCTAIINGKPVVEAHKIAVEVSAYVCTCSGAMPQLPVEIRAKIG